MLRLEDCTKEELKRIAHYLVACAPQGKYHLERALNNLSYEREKKRLDKADELAKASHEARTQIAELLKPYTTWRDVPTAVLDRITLLQAAAEAADKEWAKLMNIDL